MPHPLPTDTYTKEFDSNPRNIAGIATSSAAFIGVAEKGPVGGPPQLVTSFFEFNRIYGSYLSDETWGTYRFLAYAVEHFFINGGTGAFIARVAPSDAACAGGMLPAGELPAICAKAKNPGSWGNHIQVTISPSSKAKTQICEVLEAEAGKGYLVKNAVWFYPGDVVAFSDGDRVVAYNKVIKSKNNVITLEHELQGDVVDQALIPRRILSTCEFDMEVRCADVIESYTNLSFNRESPDFVEKKLSRSALIAVTCPDAAQDAPQGSPIPPFNRMSTGEQTTVHMNFTGGYDGSASKLTAADFIGADNGPGQCTGIRPFFANSEAPIIGVPGITDPDVQLALVAQCEQGGSSFAVLDIPRDRRTVQEIQKYRQLFDTSYAALYYPWLTVYDPLLKRNTSIPPSGSIMGIYARCDSERGVHKAPANEAIRACVGLDSQLNKGEQDILNPAGVNLLRSFPGQGILVWSARTAASDSLWKYVNVRRLFIFIEGSIRASIGWAIFEQNDGILWMRVRRTIERFLESLWRNGYLAGTSAQEAFFVNIGQSTMTQSDIDNGRLICQIGVAPVKPAEFVIFSVTQQTENG